MIRVEPAPEPAGFDGRVRVPGYRAIYEKCGLPVPPRYARSGGRPFERIRDAHTPAHLRGRDFVPYWREALAWLLSAYDRVCAYSCFRIHPTASPSVEHQHPKSTSWDRVYEWDNYRLVALRMNAKRGVMAEVLDLFEVEDGWFALDLTFGQVIPGAGLDPETTARVQATIDALDLHDFADERMRDIQDYETGDVSMKRLLLESPFVAKEILRQRA